MTLHCVTCGDVVAVQDDTHAAPATEGNGHAGHYCRRHEPDPALRQPPESPAPRFAVRVVD